MKRNNEIATLVQVLLIVMVFIVSVLFFKYKVNLIMDKLDVNFFQALILMSK